MCSTIFSWFVLFDGVDWPLLSEMSSDISEDLDFFKFRNPVIIPSVFISSVDKNIVLQTAILFPEALERRYTICCDFIPFPDFEVSIFIKLLRKRDL